MAQRATPQIWSGVAARLAAGRLTASEWRHGLFESCVRDQTPGHIDAAAHDEPKLSSFLLGSGWARLISDDDVGPAIVTCAAIARRRRRPGRRRRARLLSRNNPCFRFFYCDVTSPPGDDVDAFFRL